VTAVDAVAGAMKCRGKIGAPCRANKAGPVNSSHAEETGLKEASVAGSALKDSETKPRSKRRAVLRVVSVLRGRSVPNVENVLREALAPIEASESSAASGLSVMNVRSEASAWSGLVVSAQSDPVQREPDRKVEAKAGAGVGVADATGADQIEVGQIAADQIGVKARGNHGRSQFDSLAQNRRKNSAM
jgi:hypothetical protein